MRTCGLVLIVIVATLCACQAPGRRPEQPPKRSPPTLGRARPIDLSPETVDAFIAWASGSGLDEEIAVRESIHASRGDEAVIDVLFQKFDEVYTKDIGYSLIVLSILGELQDATTTKRWNEVIWRPLPDPEKEPHGGLSRRDVAEMIASKAAECLAYLRTAEAEDLLKKVITEHPSVPVRSAAIDAYLYNHDDSADARKTLSGLVRQSDRKFIDRVRWNRQGDPKKFNQGLEEFYKKYPEEIADEPGEPTEPVYGNRGKSELRTNPPKRDDG